MTPKVFLLLQLSHESMAQKSTFWPKNNTQSSFNECHGCHHPRAYGKGLSPELGICTAQDSLQGAKWWRFYKLKFISNMRRVSRDRLPWSKILHYHSPARIYTHYGSDSLYLRGEYMYTVYINVYKYINNISAFIFINAHYINNSSHLVFLWLNEIMLKSEVLLIYNVSSV